ncbi:MAG TPA: NADPH-dependent FMN reductase [Pararhizobium sp.]|uniref:NADPH-dependent FMN reductase n=1 Tax=Pararhizobium sp. TaxID=1977563 RepID=UPI002B942249|nr:NADPH-dependent FMN reductase [Pararhizobium sp.]HTO34396.1 NADPH-dependent FMN reductase [Pararhizobium sp.]
MSRPLVLYALCGSLRKASSNRALLEALRDVAPADITIDICELIGDLPIFNPDREANDMPAAVLALAARIRVADGLIVSSPEYAHGIPGGLKNALDWLVSRDEIPHKPVMLIHASHRGGDALGALTEVLKTISVRLVDESFFRINLLGKSPEQRAAILAEPETKKLLSARLQRFAEAIIAFGEEGRPVTGGRD